MPKYDNGISPWLSHQNEIEKIIIENGVTAICPFAFRSYSALKEVTFGKDILSIGDGAFYDCQNLTGIVLPEHLVTIGHSAFNLCSALTKINIPGTVTFIGSGAFKSCSSITEVDIANLENWCQLDFDTGETNPLFFAHSLKLNGEPLTELDIPDSINRIGDYVFYGCKGFTKVHIPSSVTGIGKNAFGGCTGLTAVEIDDIIAWTNISFEDVASNPLYHAHHLYANGALVTDITFPDDCEKVKNYAFYGDYDIQTVTIPKGVTEIGRNAFFNCSALTDIVISEGVTVIDSHAFYNCSALNDAIIPEGVTQIGDYAFNKCSALKTVTIPTSLTNMGNYTFDGCTGLQGVYISDLSAWCQLSFNTTGNPLAYAHNLYLNGELLTKLEIPSGISTIGSFAFEGCSCFTEVTIPSGVKKIGDRAFAGCSGLKAISVPNSVGNIGSSAFAGCSRLQSISLPFPGYWRKTQTDDYQYPFGYIFGKKPYDDSYAVKQNYIYLYFKDKDGDWWIEDTETYYIPKSLKSVSITGCSYIPCYAFEKCAKIADISLPLTLTSIGENAFRNCSGLISVRYAGSENARKSLKIGKGNSSLYNAAWDYNSTEHQHIFTTDIREPGCLNPGGIVYNCSCGFQCTEDTVPALGHQYTYLPGKLPTCTEDGVQAHYECSLCHATFNLKKEQLEIAIIPANGHKLAWNEEVPPTCTQAGTKGHYSCSSCYKRFDMNLEEITDITLPATGHEFGAYAAQQKATFGKKGLLVSECHCGKKRTKVLNALKTVTLSTSSYTYNGKVRTPSVTVTDSTQRVLVKNKDYTVTYASGRKNVGKYSVKITLKGYYSGTKTVTFTIKPKATSFKRLAERNGGFRVQWKKQATQVTGYQIQYSRSQAFTSAKTVTVSSYKTGSKTVRNLSRRKKYYVRLRTYRTVKGTKYFSSWSAVLSVRT